eukprot:5416560-Karenia_brevis.AAC.1
MSDTEPWPRELCLTVSCTWQQGGQVNWDSLLRATCPGGVLVNVQVAPCAWLKVHASPGLFDWDHRGAKRSLQIQPPHPSPTKDCPSLYRLIKD